MNLDPNIIIYDIEANNLYPYQDKVWVISMKRYGKDEWLKLNPFKDKRDIKKLLLDFIFKYPNPMIVAHNGIGYDQWVLWKEFGLDFRLGKDQICGRDVTFFDTLYVSQYLLPDRKGGHSLKSWGLRFGDEKIDYRQVLIDLGVLEKGSPKGTEFLNYHPKMDEYCDQDVIVTEQTFDILYKELSVHNTFNAFRLGQKNFYLMAAQGFTGIEFDKPKAENLISNIEEMIQQLKDEVEPELPKRNLKKSEESFYKIPSTIFKKDGSMGNHFIKFLEKHDAEVLEGNQIKVYNKVYPLESNLILDVKLSMNLEDQKELKQYFLDSGWIPTMWNVKKDSNGKAVRNEKRQLIFTSPKIQENKVICPNLLELDGEIPKKIVKFMSLRNRLGVLKGWLKNPRLEWDGRLTTGSSGIANTHRQKHHTVVNVPKAQDDVLLGKEFRSLFKVEEGYNLIGVDQAALEARCQGHWTYRYDSGESARELINGDVHSKNAKAFYPEETKNYDINSEDFNPSDKGFKPYRSKSKNGGYAIMYGCAPPKLAATLGKPEKLGKKLLDNFWKANPALKKLKDKVEEFWSNNGDKQWIPGIDKRRLYSRSKHSLINLLFQSTGAIIVDYALALFDQKMGGLLIDDKGRPYYKYKNKIVRRVIYSHDEYQVACENEISKEISEIMEWTMVEAGKRLKIKIPLEGKADIGINWMETH